MSWQVCSFNIVEHFQGSASIDQLVTFNKETDPLLLNMSVLCVCTGQHCWMQCHLKASMQPHKAAASYAAVHSSVPSSSTQRSSA